MKASVGTIMSTVNRTKIVRLNGKVRNANPNPVNVPSMMLTTTTGENNHDGIQEIDIKPAIDPSICIVLEMRIGRQYEWALYQIGAALQRRKYQKGEGNNRQDREQPKNDTRG